MNSRLCSRFILLVASMNASALSAANASETGAKLDIRVQDASGMAVSGASVQVYVWTGRWEPTVHRGRSDTRGRLVMQGAPPDRYIYLIALADGYAATMQSCEVGQGESRQVTFVLRRPVHSWLTVVSPDGSAVPDAEVSRMDVREANGNVFVLSENSEEVFGFRFARSDKEGRIHLPPLPENATLTITVVHPDWVPNKLEGIRVQNGEVARIRVVSGVRGRLEFVASPGSEHLLTGKPVLLSISADHANSGMCGSLRHAFCAENGGVDFTVSNGDYDELEVGIAGFQVTPVLRRQRGKPIAELRFRLGERRVLSFLVRPKVSVRGRVLRDDGAPAAGVTVVAMTENLVPNSSGREKPVVREEPWVLGDTAVTDEQGGYTLMLPPGGAVLAVVGDGIDANPDEVDVVVAPDGSTSVPDISVRQSRSFRGVVQDASGGPVVGAIVRALHTGDSTPRYTQTDAKGEFAVQLSEMRDCAETDKATKVIAFDPHSNRVGMTPVDAPVLAQNPRIVITVERRAPMWLQSILENEAAQTDEVIVAELQQRYPKGRAGSPVPDLSQGVWLNSSAKSLADFRGKLVLLDFWFIGCGPCAQEMPNVKLAHEAFQRLGFSVVSVHVTAHTVEAVRQHAHERGMTYPIVVDTESGTVLSQYRELGVRAFPSYILVDRDGKVLVNDQIEGGVSLRQHLLEQIYCYLQQR